MEISVIHHASIAIGLIWVASCYDYSHPVLYFISFIYLYLVHDRYVMRLRRKIQFEERKQANQRRVLSDSETVRWLNHAVEKIWPVCMEQIVSQKILLPIVPWFLQKFKPWTVKDAVVQSLYMGRSPPMFTDIRVLRQPSDDDHLVLELGMNFLTADDMSAILAVKLRRRLGLGMWAKLHLTSMHVEGKVMVGVKFLRRWPFISRLRVCFAEPPYFQLTVKPLVAHGFDVTELPGIAGWLDKLLSVAFEQTLVEPNMLVVDVEKFASPQPKNWFTVDAKEPIAHVLVEVMEASDMKPSDMNGLADPYIKGQLGPYRFRTKTQKKTLSPKWHEEFKIPICTWESANVLNIEVRDKDHFVDDTLGNCSICINDLRGGHRHDMWLSLHNIKMGRLHLAITVVEVDGKEASQPCDGAPVNNENSFVNDDMFRESYSGLPEKSPKVADKFEPIDVEGQQETGIWVHRPGTEVAQIWEPRKGKDRLIDSQILGERGDPNCSFRSLEPGSSHAGGSSTDERQDGDRKQSSHRVQRGLQKVKTVFRRSGKEDKIGGIEVPIPSPHDNIRAVNTKGVGVNFIVENNLSTPGTSPKVQMGDSMEGNGSESPNKGNVKGMAKSILKHAGNSARGLKNALSRKGSNKSKESASRDICVGSDSSDKDSLASPMITPEVERDPVLSKPESGLVDDSSIFVQHSVQKSPSDPEVSDKHSLASPVVSPQVERGLVLSNLESGLVDDSSSFDEHAVQKNPSDPEVDILVNEASVQGFQGINGTLPRSVEGQKSFEEHLSKEDLDVDR